MDILYVSTLYPPAVGGAQLHLHRLAGEVARLGHSVQVVTHTSRYRRDWVRLSTFLCEKGKEYEFEGIPVSQLGFSAATRVRMLPWAILYYPFPAPAVRKISHCMRPYLEPPAQKASLIHATRIGREFIARASLELARKRDIPFVLTPNHHPRWKGFLYREYDRIYREADALIALTSAEKEMLVKEKGVPEERVHVTGIGPVLAEHFDGRQFREKFGVRERFVLFLGQQLRYKGVASLVRAAPLVWESHPDVQFVFIGPPTDYSRKIFAAVDDPRILNLGEVDLKEKTAALSECEFLCMPSAQESFGGVYVEAWSLRKAVIGGRIPPIAAVIDEGRDGLLTSQEPTELADHVGQLLSDPAACSALGEAGWRKVQQHFTWEQLARKTCSLYQRLCSGKPSPHFSALSGHIPCELIPEEVK